MDEHSQPSVVDALEMLRKDLIEALEGEDREGAIALLLRSHPSDAAEVLSYFDSDDLVEITRSLLAANPSFCAEMLIEYDQSIIAGLYGQLTTREWAALLKELSDDDAVYILDTLPEEAHDLVVARMPGADQQDVRQLMNYPEESAGRIMTTEFLAVESSETVESVVELIRKTRDIDPVNLLFIYVTEKGRLVGMVSMRQLLISKRNVRVDTLMRTKVTPIHVNTDQEAVAELVSRHDQVTVPVVDDQGKILGIITVDDVIDVINEESEEDLYKQIGSSEEELRVKDDVPKVVWLRLPWILASFVGSVMVVLIMRFTERGVFHGSAGWIFTFVPMISAMGGNVGVQSSTIMARLLSHSNLDWREARRSTVKEAKVGLSLGAICGALIGVLAYIWGGPVLVFTVWAAMICTLTVAAITGTVIPVLMKRLGYDPALATGPFVTSFNDFIAICVYFSIVYALRQQLGV